MTGTVDAKKNTSTVVVALPASNDKVNEFGPEQKHATILFFGTLDGSADTIKHSVRNLASQMSAFEAEVGTTGELGQDDPPAFVVHLKDGSPLAGIREQLLGNDHIHEAWSAIDQYPEFKPHVTLGYGDEVSDDDREDVLANVDKIQFDRLAVWSGDEQTEYPLGAHHLEEGMVAGVRYVRTQEGARRFGVPVGSQIEVNRDGKVVSVKKASIPPASGRGASTPPRPDPNRKPSKFVPTVPGQKAKLAVSAKPGTVAGGTTSSGLNSHQRSAMLDMTKIHKYLNTVTSAQADALIKMRERQALTSQDKAALRGLIQNILAKIHNAGGGQKSSSSKKQQQTAAQKSATQKAQQASSKSTSSAKKAAQAKAQKAASQMSAWERTLRACYKALGGNPKDLPAGGSGSSSSASSKSGGHSKSSSSGGSSTSSKGAPQHGFTSMNDKELTHAIRQLVGEIRGNPSTVLVSALRRAKAVRDRRALEKRKHDKQTREFIARSGGGAG